ncbi:MAG: alpha/beta fold hydrolase [Solirubrobacteraceae bacterium]
MSKRVLSGERFADVGRGIELCYETFGDPADPPLLLIMGLGVQLIGWQDDFCQGLAARGFHVIRFDNRDAGLSTRIKGRPPTLLQIVTRRFHPKQYTLADMADDAAGLVRELDLGPVHLVGASLGGMVAQTVAARHPDAVRSLTSIMSTTGSRFKGQPRLDIYRYVLAQAPRGREAFVEHAAKLFAAIGSLGFPTDPEEVRERARRSFDRGTNPAGSGRQLAAILKSGDRTSELRGITAPTLVIHGSADKLVAPSGGRATARAIAGAELMEIEGMGHDLPRGVWPRVLAGIADHAHAADRALQAA